MLLYIILLLINAGFACIVAHAAKEKGYSPVGFWFLSFFVSFVIGIIVVSVIKDKHTEEEKLVGEDESSIVLKNNFTGKYLSFLLLFIVFSLSITFFNVMGFGDFAGKMGQNMLTVFLYIAVMGFAVLISTRSKGLDLSIPSTMALCGVVFGAVSQTNGLIVGAVVALIVCIIAGALNGLVIGYLKVTSIFATLITGFIFSAVAYFIARGQMFPLQLNDFLTSKLFYVGVFVTVLILTMIILIFTKLGKQMSKRHESGENSFINFVAYIICSVFAGIAGIMMAVRLNVGTASIGNGLLMYVIVFAAILSSSRLCDNKYVPVLVILGSAFLSTFINTELAMAGVGYQDIITGVIALIFVSIMFIARKKEFKHSLNF